MSLRVLGWKVTIFAHSGIAPIAHKEVYKKCPDTDHTKISLGVSLSLSHPPLSPLGVSFEFSDEHRPHFYMRVPCPPPPPPPPGIESDLSFLRALPVNIVRMYIEIPNQFQLSISIFMCLQCPFVCMYQIKCPSPTPNRVPSQPPSNFNLS